MRSLLAALASILAIPSIAGAQRPLTEAQLRALPPQDLARRLLGDLASIAYPQPRESRIEADGTYVVRYLTRPRASYRTGICQTEDLGVALEPLGPPGPDRSLRPLSIWTNKGFFIGDLTQARHSTVIPGASPDGTDAACAAIDPRQVEIIFADNPEAIASTIGWVADLLDSARSGRSLAPVSCVDFREDRLPQSACLAKLAALQATTLNGVDLVDGCWGMDFSTNRLEHRCWRVWLWDAQHRGRIQMNFIFRWSRQELIRVTVRPAPGLITYE